MFSVNNDQNPNDAISCTGVVPGTVCGAALGTILIQLFGAIPAAFKATPLVFTQRPNPQGRDVHDARHPTRPGSDAGEARVYSQPADWECIRTPAQPQPRDPHEHCGHTEWWQVRPALVLSAADWPSEDGTTGITSTAKLIAALKAGRVVVAPSNFFLYFGSQMSADMPKSKLIRQALNQDSLPLAEGFLNRGEAIADKGRVLQYPFRLFAHERRPQ
jgi:hypothetical protein